jgi:hypothetical protein
VPDYDDGTTSVGASAVPSTTSGKNFPAKKPAYPKAVFFILVTEFAERFSFYGMKSAQPCVEDRVARFFLVQQTKTRKKCTKWS